MITDFSDEQENEINEILEKGIDQIKHRIPKINDRKEYKAHPKHERNKDDCNYKQNYVSSLSNNCNKKIELKNLLDKIKSEERAQIKEKSKVAKDADYNSNYMSSEEKEKIPTNMSNIKKELSTLQNTIDNLEKKLFDNPSLSLNSFENGTEKFYKMNDDFSTQSRDTKPTQRNDNNLSMIEYTKQILEKNLKTIHSKKLEENNNDKSVDFNNVKIYKTNVNPDDNNYSTNDKVNYTRNSLPNAKDKKHLINQLSNEDKLRINDLKYTLIEKEKFIMDLKDEINRLYFDKEKLNSELYDHKKIVREAKNEIATTRSLQNDNDELKYKLLKLTDDYNVMCNKYNRSEYIRYQQSKMINSLQAEIDLLRNRKIRVIDDPLCQDVIDNKVDDKNYSREEDKTNKQDEVKDALKSSKKLKKKKTSTVTKESKKTAKKKENKAGVKSKSKNLV